METETLGAKKKTHREAYTKRTINTQTEIVIPKQLCVGTQIPGTEIHTPTETKTYIHRHRDTWTWSEKRS